jgi:C1A family cysteine protease
MAGLDIAQLRAAIQARGLQWNAVDLPADFVPRGLGWNPTPPEVHRVALETAQRLMATRMSHLFPQAMSIGSSPAPLGGPAGGPAYPRSFDWRSRGVIGPVTDQRACGSCVSFATTGLVGAMVGVEHNSASVHLSEADQHFCSPHGPNCGGWNNGDALNQIKSRGVVADADFPYMTAFDKPPVDDPSFLPDHIWVAHCRPVSDRNRKIFNVTEVAAWTGDTRKIYLAHVGPLVCGFTVYEDFDHYAGGVYRHVSGKVRGGHAVLVVGYSDDDQCWICRNSWGDGFGGAARPDGTGAGFFKMGYGECGSDNEAFYGAQGVIAPASANWRGWWPVAGGIAAPNTSVFGVSRSADHLDIFAVGTDHGAYTAAWQPGDANWRGWWRVQGGVAAANTSITAVSRGKDKLDIFCVGTDQHIYTAAWQAGDTSWRGWWPVAGGIAAPGTSVFGVCRSADHLDIFAVGTDHGTYTAAWQPGDANWRGWWRVQGGVAAANTSITAVSRSENKLDIFCVGTDQRIYTAAWQAGDTSWRGWWPVAGGVAAPGTSVFGVCRSADHLDIFAVGTDMQVYTAAWQTGDTTWRGWWPIGHFKVAPGTSIHAVSRSADKIDIFAVGQDGGVYSASWQAGDVAWRGWWRILDGVAAPNTMVTAVVRSPDHLDIFSVGADHHIYTAAWQP